MSEGFMADPIRPGNNINNTQPTMQSSNKSSAGIVVLLVVLIIFVVPMIFIFSIFSKVWGDIKGDVSDAIKNEGANLNLHLNDYKLSATEQEYATRIWGNVYTAKETANISLHRGDCRALKNMATNFANQNKLAQRWYDTTYCDSTKVNAGIEIVTSNNADAGGIFRLVLRDSEKPGDCVLLDFEENFQYLAHVSTFKTCSTTTFSLKDDNYNEIEVKPQYDEDQENENVEDAGDDIDNPPIQKS